MKHRVLVDGRLVYSTCTISPHENDAVMGKLNKSRAGRFQVVPSQGVL